MGPKKPVKVLRALAREGLGQALLESLVRRGILRTQQNLGGDQTAGEPGIGRYP